MKIFILTEAGSSIAFGHLAMCLSLSDGFRRHGITVKFLINLAADVRKILKIKNYRILDWVAEKKRHCGF